MADDDPRNAAGESLPYDPLSTSIVGNTGIPTRARVLVVDPDVRFGLLLKGFLETRGWGALWVSDGRKALRDWDRLRPDVVVTELDGEDIDGFEFVAAVRRRSSTLPVVVCTRLAGATQWTPSDRRALGVEAVLVRPVQFMQLHSTLEAVLAA
ncbi:MAG: response regulator [Deltaproteobacteria bacterium]|nr:response regulator [Deltaproteobacteria bacterium]